MKNKTIAFIPVRGGSKSIPLKNIKLIAGKPLIYWTAKAANDCLSIDKVYIATDSDDIKRVSESFKLDKVEVIGRSKESASDTATTESAMIEFANEYDFDNIILVQATSPLLQSDDLERGIALFNDKETDSVLSVVRQKRFVWKVNESGYAIPENYDFNKRPRRQEFNGFLVENGAFYITKKEDLLRTGCRLSGNVKACEMSEVTYTELDEPSDWIITERHLIDRAEKKETKIPSIDDVKLFLMDCDGVLTDGGMYYSEKGDELKKFNTLDGLGIRLLKERGIIVGIITGEDRELNKRRAKKLGVDILKSGVSDKISAVNNICEEYEVDLKNVVYIGDDINDLEVIKSVGFGCSVANGQERVQKAAKYVTKREGGSGAVREIINLILREG